jgi:hypothetical protein
MIEKTVTDEIPRRKNYFTRLLILLGKTKQNYYQKKL